MSYIVGTGIIKGGGVGDIEQINKNMNDIIKIVADLQNVSTSEILEGANLYYTEERVSANIALKSTTDIAEGNNLYYTENRVNPNIASKSTTDITEGDNLYIIQKIVWMLI